jgi:hypothetical protein
MILMTVEDPSSSAWRYFFREIWVNRKTVLTGIAGFARSD